MRNHCITIAEQQRVPNIGIRDYITTTVKISMFASMLSTIGKSLPIITFCFVLFALIVGCTQNKQQSLRIATAANVQYAMEDIVEAFTEQSGIKAEIVISSSGKLCAQIAQGAPYDIFISADMEYPMRLYLDGHAIAEPRLYAYGEIVIWSNSDIEPTFDAMLHKDVDRVAVPNPKTAPYGRIAMTALRESGILEALQDKLVIGENVGQVNQFVASGAAEIGITAKSMVMSSRLKGKGKWVQISEDLYTPISQGMIVIDRDDGFKDDAMKFYDFMISDIARKLLADNGYKLSST